MTDRFLYYAHLAGMVWPGHQRILRTTAWATLDRLSTPEQKVEAERLTRMKTENELTEIRGGGMTENELIEMKWEVCEHWLEIYQLVDECEPDGLEELKLPIYSESCTYCKVYDSEVTGVPIKERCNGCPVKAATGKFSCHGTPWIDVDKLQWSGTYRELKEAVIREYQFLVAIALGNNTEEFIT